MERTFDMKKRLLCLLLCTVMLLALASCASERYDLLYSVELDGLTYCVRGSGTRAKQIVVKSGEEVLWSKKVRVDKSLGTLKGTYGFAADDLNFDGYRDLQIAIDQTGDCVESLCFLYDAAGGKYVKSEELSALYNVKANAELKAVFGFEHTYTTEPAYLDVPASSISTDTATKYVWRDGVLTPDIRVSITFYSESARYLYSVAYYDTETKTFFEDDAKDAWLTADEYKEMDMSFLYYFK